MNALLLLLVSSLTVSAFAQRSPSKLEPCTTNLPNAPNLRGFKLGQTTAEIEERLPGFRSFYHDAWKESEFEYVLVHSFKLPDSVLAQDRALSDVSFTLHFLDGAVVFIHIDYSSYDVDTLDQYIARVSETTGLPSKSWVREGKYRARISCNGFSANIWTGKVEEKSYYQAFPTFSLTDLKKDIEVAKRKKAQDDAEKAAFLEQQKINDQRKREKAESERLEAERRRVFKP